MYSLINCTPHTINLTKSLMPGQVMRYVRSTPERNGGWNVPGDDRHTTLTRAIVASGFRFACTAVTYGPDLGCGVRYELSDEAKAERELVWRACESMQGSNLIVIASEISVRCLADSLDQGHTSGFRVRAMWPVLAAESLRLPMSQRWADKLATLPG
jgi:hypothetical protein